MHRTRRLAILVVFVTAVPIVAAAEPAGRGPLAWLTDAWAAAQAWVAAVATPPPTPPSGSNSDAGPQIDPDGLAAGPMIDPNG